jgi:hypothetical protein
MQDFLELELNAESIAFLTEFSRLNEIPIEDLILLFLQTGMKIIPAFSQAENLVSL